MPILKKCINPNFYYSVASVDDHNRKGLKSMLCLKDFRQHTGLCFTGFSVKIVNSARGQTEEGWDCRDLWSMAVIHNGDRIAGAGLQHQISLPVRGYQGLSTWTGLPVVGFYLLTGAWNTLYFGNRKPGNKVYI